VFTFLFGYPIMTNPKETVEYYRQHIKDKGLAETRELRSRLLSKYQTPLDQAITEHLEELENQKSKSDRRPIWWQGVIAAVIGVLTIAAIIGVAIWKGNN